METLGTDLSQQHLHFTLRMDDWILKYILIIEEEEVDKHNIREFTKLIEQHEQVWKPAKEELETIDMGNE